MLRYMINKCAAILIVFNVSAYCAFSAFPSPCCHSGSSLLCGKHFSDLECRCSASPTKSRDVFNRTVNSLHSHVQINNLEQCLQSLILNSINNSLKPITLLNSVGHNLSFSGIALVLNGNTSLFKARMAEVRIEKLNIKKLNGSTFHAFKRLSGLLSLRSNSLQTIFPETFGAKALRGVQRLDLSHNTIHSICDNSFAILKRLKKLDLSYNQLRNLPSEVFHGLTKIQELNLNHNKMKTVDFSWFLKLRQLKILSFSHNNVSEIQFLTESRDPVYSTSTTICSNLTNKDVNNSTPVEKFNTSCSCCKQLFDNSNKFGVDENETASPLFEYVRSCKIREIYLSFNNLNNVSLALFSLFPRLRLVDLSHNRILSLDGATSFLCCLNRTRSSKLELVLSHNRLKTIRRQDFKFLPNLQLLDVSCNAIHHVDKNMFLNLQSVNLSHNYLTKFHRISKKKLEDLDLSYNPLKIKPEVVADAMATDSGGQLLIEGVVFSCDENLLKFLTYFACNELKESEKYVNPSFPKIGNLAENQPNQTIFPPPGNCLALHQPTKSRSLPDALLRNNLLSSCTLLAMKKHGRKKAIKKLLFNWLDRQCHYVHVWSKRSNISAKTLFERKQKFVRDLEKLLYAIEVDDSTILIHPICNDIITGVVSMKRENVDGEISTNRNLWFKPTKNDVDIVIGNTVTKRKYKRKRNKTCKGSCQHENIKTGFGMEIMLPPSLYFHQKIGFIAYNDKFFFPSNHTVLSAVISAEIHGKVINNLQEPVVINANINLLPIKENIGSKTKPLVKCSFWDFNQSSWSQDGCRLVNSSDIDFTSSNTSRVTCHCNHLTNFAVLLTYDSSDEQEVANDLAINLVSYLGVCVSMVCLSVTLAYRLSMKKFREGIPQLILIHLCFCLLLLNVLITIHDKPRVLHDKNGCLFVGILLHYFIIAVFGWQLIEGVAMCLMLGRVFNVNRKKFITKSSALCYGGSALWVVGSLCYVIASQNDSDEDFLSVIQNSYRFGNSCLVGYPNHLYFVVLPAAFTCSFNFVVFIFMLRILKKQNSPKKNLQKIKVRLRQAMCVTLLLGITWIVGFLKIALQVTLGHESSVAWASELVFVAANSLQGFFIFLMFCASNLIEEIKSLALISKK